MKRDIFAISSLGLVLSSFVPIITNRQYIHAQNQSATTTNVETNAFASSSQEKLSRDITTPPEIAKFPMNDNLLDEMRPTTELEDATISFNYNALERHLGATAVFGLNETMIIDLGVAVNDNTYVKDHVSVELHFLDKSGKDVILPRVDYKTNQVLSMFINSNLVRDYSQVYVKAKLTNPLGRVTIKQSNVLNFQIVNEHFPKAIPTPDYISLNTVGNLFPLGKLIHFDNSITWLMPECHDTYIQYKWWASDGYVKCLYKNLSGLDGCIFSEGSLIVLRTWYLEVVIDEVSYWSKPTIFTPDDDPGSRPPSGPLIQELTIKSENPTNEYFSNENIIINSSIKWTTVDTPAIPITYRWYAVDEYNNEMLIYDQKGATLNMKAAMKYNGKKIKLRAVYRGGIYSESNFIHIKVFKMVDYPLIDRIVLVPNKKGAKYEKGEDIVINADITWSNPVYTTSIDKYEWIITDRKGNKTVLKDNTPTFTMIAQVKDTRSSIVLKVTYANVDSPKNEVFSVPLRLIVWTRPEWKQLSESSEIKIIGAVTGLITLIVLSIVVTYIGVSYRRDMDKYKD